MKSLSIVYVRLFPYFEEINGLKTLNQSGSVLPASGGIKRKENIWPPAKSIVFPPSPSVRPCVVTSECIPMTWMQTWSSTLARTVTAAAVRSGSDRHSSTSSSAEYVMPRMKVPYSGSGTTVYSSSVITMYRAYRPKGGGDRGRG